MTLEYPYDCEEGGLYVERLKCLANYRESDAARAHQQFYQLVHSLFGRGYRPTNLLPL